MRRCVTTLAVILVWGGTRGWMPSTVRNEGGGQGCLGASEPILSIDRVGEEAGFHGLMVLGWMCCG